MSTRPVRLCGSRKFVVTPLLALGMLTVAKPSSPGQTGVRAGQEPAHAKPETPKAVDWGALFRMHYTNRVRSFREQNLAYQNVVLLGDSITEGFEPVRYFPGRRVLNRGIGGDVIGNDLAKDDTRGVLRRLDESIFDCAATDVFLMIGINDLNSGRKVDGMEAGYRAILDRIRKRAPALKIHVESLLPTRGAFDARNAPVREFNLRLKALAVEFRADYLDLHANFADADGRLKAEFTNDGLHLTDAGYRRWQGIVEDVMGWRDRAGESPGPSGASQGSSR